MERQEFLELLEKQVEIYPRASSHVEYTVDSKGVVKPTVKVYHEKADEAFLMGANVVLSDTLK